MNRTHFEATSASDILISTCTSFSPVKTQYVRKPISLHMDLNKNGFPTVILKLESIAWFHLHFTVQQRYFPYCTSCLRHRSWYHLMHVNQQSLLQQWLLHVAYCRSVHVRAFPLCNVSSNTTQCEEKHQCNLYNTKKSLFCAYICFGKENKCTFSKLRGQHWYLPLSRSQHDTLEQMIIILCFEGEFLMLNQIIVWSSKSHFNVLKIKSLRRE